MLHKQVRCEPQLRWWVLALALLTLVMPSLLLPEIVTGTTSGMVVKTCGSWCG